MNSLPIGSVTHGFRVISGGEIPCFHAHYRKLSHVLTGAVLYYTTRDDGQLLFGVGFRTLPEDDTGVFHILEHSCLDGSEHYPLKEPFVNLMKTSMASDLNAVTYSDKTYYYFASPNEQDYLNLMSVYLDAVFFPLLLRDRRIFEKEAWHLEPDGEGGVSCSGVVFNEMQGCENDPEVILWQKTMEQLFPDLHLSHVSGGDTSAIPTLTYEAFTETYRRFYTTDNATFYLSGRMDVDKELEAIDRVLCARGKSPIPGPAVAPLQSPVENLSGEVCYPLAENEPLEGNTRLMLTFVMNADDAEEDVLGMALLSQYLAKTTESPLSEIVLKAGVGQDFGMACDANERQPIISFTLNKSDPGQADAFRQVVLDALSHTAREGLPHDRMQDLIRRFEVDCRRASLNVWTGLDIMENFFRQEAEYGDVVPRDNVKKLKERFAADDRYFAHLIERYILHNRHTALTRCIPSYTAVNDRKQERLDQWLKGEADRLRSTEGGLEALEAHCEAFRQYLTAPDSPEAEASIPRLKSTQIGTPDLFGQVEETVIRVGGTQAPSLFYRADTDGIAAAGLSFDMTGVDEKELFAIRCLRDALFSLPTASHTVNELTDRATALLASLGCSFTTSEDGKVYFSVDLNVPEENLVAACDLLDEYLREVVFDRDILKRIFSNASDMRSNLIWNGHGTALTVAQSSFSLNAVYQDCLNGVRGYRALADLVNHFDDRMEAWQTGMSQALTRLSQQVRPTVYVIGSDKARKIWEEQVSHLSVAHDIRPTPSESPLCLSSRDPVALTIPNEVNYCAEVMDLSEVGQAYTPRFQVVSQYLYSQYFWDEIRAKGGAYGAMVNVSRTGLVRFVSYRDPRVADTYRAFDGVPAYLDTHTPDKTVLDALIVSSAGAYFTPMGPLQKGFSALAHYRNHRTAEDLRAELQDILSVSEADFRAYADAIRALQESGRTVMAVLGNARTVSASGLFEAARTEEL